MDWSKMKKKLLVLVVLLLVQSTYGKKHPQQQPPKPTTAGPVNSGPPPQPWLTLDGKRPAVVAKGGVSMLFPYASERAIRMAAQWSIPGVIISCDLQLSKDRRGYCLQDLNIESTTDILTRRTDLPRQTYFVNGQNVTGHFLKDLTDDQVSELGAIQYKLSRPRIPTDEGVVSVQNATDFVHSTDPPARFWLHVQNSTFFAQHNLDPAMYIEEALKHTGMDFISSTEVGLLKTLGTKIDKAHTQLVFYALEENRVEPTTNQTYGALLKDLKAIKMFASVIVVPKQMIWPANPQGYLLPEPTTLVNDAHKEGLLVYANNFANDDLVSFNYSHDPNREYLQFMDNGRFAVDGFLTDVPNTVSETMVCLAHNKNATRKDKQLVIASSGASGVYPGSTDLAYLQAADDGADIIGCSVQMTKDGIAFCLNSTNLAVATDAMETLVTRSTTVPEIQTNPGIFSFDFTWSEILNLKPLLASSSPTSLPRNPINKNKGKFVTLAEFLELAKQKKVLGVMISIQNAAYLASKKGMDIVDAVTSGLRNATLDKPSTQQVWIQSDDSAVLSNFSNNAAYKRVFLIEEPVTSVSKQAIDEIKKFADAVHVLKGSIIPVMERYGSLNLTSIVDDMHKANLSVFSGIFRNEFSAIEQDFFSCATTEIATHLAAGVDGVVTEYPATADTYLRSPCVAPGAKTELSIPILPGNFIQGLEYHPPPAPAPLPPLDVAGVVAPPLPPVSKAPTDGGGAAPAPAPPAKNNQTANVANFGFSLFISIIILGCLV